MKSSKASAAGNDVRDVEGRPGVHEMMGTTSSSGWMRLKRTGKFLSSLTR